MRSSLRPKRSISEVHKPSFLCSYSCYKFSVPQLIYLHPSSTFLAFHRHCIPPKGGHDDGYATLLRSLCTQELEHKIILLRTYKSGFARDITALRLPSLIVKDVFHPVRLKSLVDIRKANASASTSSLARETLIEKLGYTAAYAKSQEEEPATSTPRKTTPRGPTHNRAFTSRELARHILSPRSATMGTRMRARSRSVSRSPLGLGDKWRPIANYVTPSKSSAPRRASPTYSDFRARKHFSDGSG